MARQLTAMLVLGILGCTGVVGEAGTGKSTSPLCSSTPQGARFDLRRLTPVQYQNAIRDIFAERLKASSRYPGPYGVSGTGYTTEPGINDVGEQGASQILAAAEEVALATGAALSALLPCAATAAGSAAQEACAMTYVDIYGRRAYRRALTDTERAALLKTYRAATSAGGDLGGGVMAMTSHLLQSPQFLYQVEDAAGDGRALTAVELASRLSFLFWDSIPDDALASLAQSGELASPEVLAREARRLLESPKASATLARFFREWTQTKRLFTSDKDPAAYPFFTAPYAESLNDSFDRFVVAQVREHGTLTSLFTSPDAYVDSLVAPAYGVTPPAPGAWVKVTLDVARYAGISTQALTLASSAHPIESSFVFRGRMVRKRFLCDAFPTPPADAATQFAQLPLPPNPTAKESAAGIESKAGCVGCHRVIDPPGLAFEGFDGAGQARTAYASGRAITIDAVMPMSQGDPLSFTGPPQLAAGLAAHDAVRQCLGRQLFRFTFSRSETDADACSVRTIADTIIGGAALEDALLAIVSTDAFSHRSDL